MVRTKLSGVLAVDAVAVVGSKPIGPRSRSVLVEVGTTGGSSPVDVGAGGGLPPVGGDPTGPIEPTGPTTEPTGPTTEPTGPTGPTEPTGPTGPTSPPPPPDTTITSGPTGRTNATTPSFGFDGDAGSTFECKLNSGAYASCTSPRQLGPLADGDYVLSVRATLDGVTDPTPAQRSFTVDATPPGAPTVVRTSPTANPTASTTQAISIAPAESGGTLGCTLDGAAYLPCDAGTVNLSGLMTGTYTFAVWQTDDVGNAGSAASVVWDVNSGGVAAPTISAGPGPASYVNSATSSFAFSSATDGVTYECRVDAAAFAACTSAFSTGALADGAHSFYVRARNNVGTYSAETSRQWNIDTSPPAVPTVSIDSPSVSPTQSKSASISFAGEANANFYGELDGAAFAKISSPVALSNLVDGAHVYSVFQVDRAGNPSGTASVTWTVDTTAPAAPTLTRTLPGSTPTTSRSASLSASGVEPGAQLQFTTNGGGTWSNAPANPIALSNLADGTYSYAVRAVDAAGNAGGASNAVTWTVDTTGPPAPGVSGPSGTTALQSASISFSDTESGVTFECALDGGASPSYSACSSPVSLSGLGNGAHTYDVRAKDTLGNAGPATRIGWTVDTSAFTAQIDGGPSGTVASSSAAFTYSSPSVPGAGFECKNVLGAASGAFAACPGTGVTYSGLTDGTYTFTVHAKSGAQTSPDVTRSYTVDRTAPVVSAGNPGTTGPGGTISFTATDPTAPVTTTCSLDGAAAASCANIYTFAALSSGTHTLSIVAKDGVNNAATTPVQWTVDATAPDTSISGAPSSPTQSKTASLTFGATESPATFQCNVDGAGYAACSSPLSLSNLGDGGHSVLVRASDQYGNQDQSPASVSWTVDTTPPAAPSLARTSPASSPTKLKTATLTASGIEAGAQLQFTANAGGTWTNAAANPIALSNLADGGYTYAVRAVDAAGNASAASGAVSWTVDTTAPGAPTVTRTSPTATPTASPTQDVSVSPAESGGTLSCTLNGVAYAPCAAGTISLSGLSTNTYVFAVTQTDAAGNTGSAASVTWDVNTGTVAAPTISAGPSAGSFVSSSSAQFSFSSATGGVTYECHLDAAAFTACASPASFSGLSQASHTFHVRAKNNVGTYSPETSRQWTVDTTAPAAPSLARTAPASTPTQSKSATLTASGVEAGAQLQFTTTGGGSWTNTTSPIGLSNLADGSYTYAVRAVDTAGNASASSNSVSWTVDTTPPSLSITAPTEGQVLAATSTSVSFTAEAGATTTCSLDGAPASSCSSPVSLSSLTSGSHTFAVTGVDAAGNSASVTRNFSVNLNVSLCGNVNGSTALSGGTVYTVTCDVSVTLGSTLQIPAGTILKFAAGTKLNVIGTVTADGTTGSPVVMTSIKDDSAGGDTNGDGVASSPAAGNWTGVVVNPSGSVKLNGTRLRYASVAIDAASGAGVAVHGAILNSTTGVRAVTFADATNVDWGSATGPAPAGSGTPIVPNNSDGYNYILTTPWVGYTSPPRPTAGTTYAPPSANQCRKYFLLGVRASGEAPQGSDTYQSDTYAIGSNNRNAMNALQDALVAAGGATIGDFKLFGLHYPATWAVPPSFGSTALWNSVYTGINQLDAALVWEHANCPSEKIILFGYSQGASVIQQSLRETAVAHPEIISSGQIAGVVLIGDPNRVAGGAETLWTAKNTPVVAGSAMDSTNAVWGLASMPDTGPLPAALTSRTISICHPLDFYCDPSPGATIQPHWTYVNNNYDEPKAMGQWMAAKLP